MAEGVTAEDLARDLTADLALCEAAPPGPWLDLFAGSTGLQRYVAPAGWRELPVLYSYCPPHAALDMACGAREGWPAAIRLALHWKAEAERAKVSAALEAARAEGAYAEGVKAGVGMERQRARQLRDAIREWNDSTDADLAS